VDNTSHRRSQSLNHLDRQHRIEGQEIRDHQPRSLPHQEIIPTPEAQRHQLTSPESQLRQQAEQRGINIFGLSGPEGRRNQQVDQQTNEGDSHSEIEELRQRPISPQRWEKVMSLWVDLRDAPPLERQRRSLSVNDALQQLEKYKQDAQSILHNSEKKRSKSFNSGKNRNLN
jgi:hypothetical protein